MIPEEFHDFFVASAGVAGALIGLLFVAISVHPEQIGEGGNAAVRFRPSAALSALLNSLLVSLILLVPGQQVGGGVIAFGVIGLVAVAALLLGLVPEVHGARWTQVVRTIVLLLGQGVAYAFEIVQGVRLRRGDDPGEPLQRVCVIVLVLFAIGIERAWEFVGASMPGLLGALLGLRRSRTRH